MCTNMCSRVSFLTKVQASACNCIDKETLAQVFSCEFFKRPFLQNTSGQLPLNFITGYGGMRYFSRSTEAVTGSVLQ